MSGGYWGKGNNPFFNYDYEAASQDRELHRLKDSAHKEKLEHELSISSLENELNVISRKNLFSNAEKEKRLENMKDGCFKLAIRSNIFQRTLANLMQKHPELQELIINELKVQHDHCMSDSYQKTWSQWAYDFKKNPNHYDAYFTFPFPLSEEPKK
ncbi:hypothetical protein [Kluyvera huaxiensis]|uniref:hypothetical protein n=1 Tax=Kluyvera sp. 142053 TaxID=3160979 RepID=UPI0032DF43BA